MATGIANVKGLDKSKSLFTTTTAPTESGGVITIATTDIVESGFKIGDYLTYIDSDNITALYKITAISSGTATLSLIGNVGGGGTQLHKHHLTIKFNGNPALIRVNFTIELEQSTPATISDIITYLLNNGFYNTFNDPAKLLIATGYYYNANSGNKGYIDGVYVHNYGTAPDRITCSYIDYGQANLNNHSEEIQNTSGLTIIDNII